MTGEEFFVSSGSLKTVNFSASGVEEVLQNVRTILGTIKGQVFLDRHFGIPAEIIDKPQSEIPRYMADVASEVERQEPRCKVTRIVFQALEPTELAGGRLAPCVWVRMREGMLI